MIKSLTHIAVEDIVDALHDAFSDYAIPIRMPVDYWKDRWLMANIDYDLSFGYFDDDTLAGFVLHGIDHWQNEKCFLQYGYRCQNTISWTADSSTDL